MFCCWLKLTCGLFFSRSSVNFSNSAIRNSLGFLRTHAGCAMKILKKTPPTASSPSASPNTTAKSSGNFKEKKKKKSQSSHLTTSPT